MNLFRSVSRNQAANIPKHTEKRTIRLNAKSEAYSLERQGQTLRVVAGYAWVSMDNQDIILGPGQEMQVTPGKRPIIIGAMQKKPLIFDVFEK